MLERFALGVLAQLSLLLSGLLATWVTVPERIVGGLAGFGAGALVSAVSFDLIPQAQAPGGLQTTLWLLIGAAVFIVGDLVVDRRFGGDTSSGALGIIRVTGAPSTASPG
jgi:ZIP family zinc transporter